MITVGALAFLGACGSPAKPVTPQASAKSDSEPDLRWGQRLNLTGPYAPGPVGRSGARLIPVQAEIVSMTIPVEKAASLQDDRARVSLKVTKLPEGAPRPIEYIDLWCPDALIRQRGWQVGSKVVVRLTPDYALYDVSEP